MESLPPRTRLKTSTKDIMNKQHLVLLCSALLTLSARAEEPATPAPSPLSLVLTAGYDSRYCLYGYRLSRHLFQADIYAAYAQDEKTTVWGGSWIGYLADASLREVDGYIGVDRVLAPGWTAGLSGSLFHYIESPFTDEPLVAELSGHVSYQTERWGLSVRDHVDTESDGHLVRAIANLIQPVTDRIKLKGTAEFGYALGYYTDGNLPNHALFILEAPTTLTDTVYVTPFVSRTLALEAINDFEEDDTIFGGSISWIL